MRKEKKEKKKEKKKTCDLDRETWTGEGEGMKENEKCEYIMHEKERLYIICRRLEDDVCVKEDGMYASARMKIFLNFSLIFLFPRYYYESCQKRKKILI